jgi:hypothetical protein
VYVKQLVVAGAVIALSCAPGAGAAASPTARVRIGDTEKQVAAILGKNPVLCTAKISNLCRTPVYLYEYVDGTHLGVGIQFRRVNGVERVSRVFALGTVVDGR